jgi:hypothetical protein
MTVPLSSAEHLEASRLVPNLPLTDAPAVAGRRGLAALKMYYLSYIAIFARPLAARPHRYDTMLATATAIASSPQALLDHIDALLTAAPSV